MLCMITYKKIWEITFYLEVKLNNLINDKISLYPLKNITFIIISQ